MTKTRQSLWPRGSAPKYQTKDKQEKMGQEEKQKVKPNQTKETSLEDGLGAPQDLSAGNR